MDKEKSAIETYQEMLRKEEKLSEKLANTMQEEFEKQHQADSDDKMVNHPTHYQSLSKECNIECIDAMRAAFGDEAVVDFCICNAFKYVWRHQSKNGKTDISKAVWYLNKYLKLSK